MVLPGQPRQVYEGGWPKRRRHRNPANDRASKRREQAPCDGRAATRPLTSGERLWGATSTSLLYCSEMDKHIFHISFERIENKSEPASQYQAKQLSPLKWLKYYGDAKLYGVTDLLQPYGLRPWERGQARRLQLQYGYGTLVVATDCVFQKSSTVPAVAVVIFGHLAQRKGEHIGALTREDKREGKQHSARILEEHRRIRPKKAEEDAQIALIMAAMAQEMLRRDKQKQSDAWVRVIGIGPKEIFLYQALVPRKFVETFDPGAGFTIQYRSAFLHDPNSVLQQLDCLLREEHAPRDQLGAAEEAKC